jgi:branched-chain amino acid transport system ATP-binding protein
MAILEVRNISRHFGALHAVNNVSFSLGQGEILGMIGPNGAGKTTLFNLMAGVLKPDRGTVTFKGREITGMKPHKICRLGVAKTAQSAQPFTGLTVFENVMIGALHGGRLSMKEAAPRCEEMLERMGLSDLKWRSSAALSVPDRRKLELARAMATGADLLLLDETMAGLTPVEVDDAVELLRRIRQRGKSIIVVEHVMQAVMEISDRIMVLNHGEKIAEGSPKEVAENEEVITAYLGRRPVRSRMRVR